MNKLDKTIITLLLSIVLSIATLFSCYIISEKYFFDKFFYQKSIIHGYGMYGQKPVKLEDYGNRAKDLINLNFNIQSHNTTTKKYTIALIGDSYAWGMGVRYPQTVAPILEKKLKKINKNTDILLLAKPGDSILDYYSSYKKISNSTNIDMYIFILVFNDLAFNFDDRLHDNDYEHILENCRISNGPINYLINWQDFAKQHPNHNWDDVVKEQTDNINKSWSNPANICALNTISKTLPQNSLFFITDDYENTPNHLYYQTYINEIQKFHSNIIRSNNAKLLPGYESFWKNPTKRLRISSNEFHPNAIAHKMYAELLYKEVTENKKWNFKYE